jgi:hypothetical protein
MCNRIVVGALFLVTVGCGKTNETSSSPPPSAPPPPKIVARAPPTTVHAPTPPPPPAEPASYAFVKPAFGGTVPELPQLSRDGKRAAVASSVRMRSHHDIKTFEVGFLSDTGKLERVAVLDSDTADRLGEDPAAKVDTAAMAKAASTITKRLADGGFSKLATVIDQRLLVGLGEDSRAKREAFAIPIDHAKLVVSVVVNPSGPTSLKLRLENQAGKKVTERLVPGVVGAGSNSDCWGAPFLGGVWYDRARKRVLLEIELMTAGCTDLPSMHLLWKLP